MVSLAIVAVFVLLMILSGLGSIAKDWSREIGVNYAPPTFVGPGRRDPDRCGVRPRRPRPRGPTRGAGSTPAPEASARDSTFVDPLADVMKEIEAQEPAGRRAKASPSTRWPT